MSYDDVGETDDGGTEHDPEMIIVLGYEVTCGTKSGLLVVRHDHCSVARQPIGKGVRVTRCTSFGTA